MVNLPKDIQSIAVGKSTLSSSDLIVMAVKTRTKGVEADLARNSMSFALSFLRKTFGMKCELTTQFDIVDGNLKEISVIK